MFILYVILALRNISIGVNLSSKIWLLSLSFNSFHDVLKLIVSSLISVIVALQKSKCSQINMGWGCIRCIRKVEQNEKNTSPKDNIEQVWV